MTLRCRELELIDSIMSTAPNGVRHRILGKVSYFGKSFPIPEISMGRATAPKLVMVAGVHGLERIGTEVVLAYLQSSIERLQWDSVFESLLDQTQIVFIPVVNPVGVARKTRSNGNGVDLMRNAPIEAEERGGFIHRGQSLTNRLPFFRGEPRAMELEGQILATAIEEILQQSPLTLAMDVHSGFGAMDRLWFPFSHSRKPFAHVAEALGLKRLLDKSYPNHFYRVEPMSHQYTIHGDIWDYLYLRHFAKDGASPFIPWTLEMGSWVWMKKNPLQIFTVNGIFDPVRPHRRQRILRRHLTLFDFLHRSLVANSKWWTPSPQERRQLNESAEDLWYR